MAKNLSIANVVDKNKISGGAVWVVLLDIEVVDPNTRDPVDYITITRNNEDVQYDGVTYKAANFEINIEQRQNQASTVSVVIQDQMGYIEQRLEEMAGGVFSNVVMRVVNTNRLDFAAEIEERFLITNSSAKNFVVTFELGAENPLSIAFPKHTQRQDRCAWRYRSYGCAYTGDMPTCDYTKDGPAGCRAHGNLQRFRALPGLVRMNI